VTAAAVLHDFESCAGIEYLQSLHDTALKLKKSYDIYLNSKTISDNLENENNVKSFPISPTKRNCDSQTGQDKHLNSIQKSILNAEIFSR